VRRIGAFAFLVAAAVAACAIHRQPGPGNIVASSTAPALTLEVDRSFAALPPLSFPIENLTNAERRIFVEANADRAVERLVIVQFERVRDGSDFRFLYPSRPPRRFGAETYRFGTFAYDDERAAAIEPAKEAARTRAYLASAGYKSARVYRVARLARVTDAGGLSEVIIFYMENADRTFTAGPLPGADEDGDVPIEGAEQEALLARLSAAIRVLKG
jgi:hypothetical protein